MSPLGALATCRGAGFTVLMMLGAALTAIVFAVTDDRVLTQFAVAVGAGAGRCFHQSDSIRVVVQTRHQCRT